MKKQIVFALAVLLGLSAIGKQNRWIAGDPVLLPGPEGSFDEISVKDPSIVFFNGKWHLFYTARGKGEYATGYVSAPTLDGLQGAPRHELRMIRGKSRYGCAPQVFYFSPQKTWYLIFQTRDADYQPVYSTTRDIADPESWSEPKTLIEKDSKAKWIDFWLLCYEGRAYLYYTEGHNGVVVRSTELSDFPRGWGEGKRIYKNIAQAGSLHTGMMVSGERRDWSSLRGSTMASDRKMPGTRLLC